MRIRLFVEVEVDDASVVAAVEKVALAAGLTPEDPEGIKHNFAAGLARNLPTILQGIIPGHLASEAIVVPPLLRSGLVQAPPMSKVLVTP